MLSKFFTSTLTRESSDNIPEFQDREFVTCLDDISIDVVDIVREKLCDFNFIVKQLDLMSQSVGGSNS